MTNESLARDYLKRCDARLAAIDTLFKKKSWPDVVREAQEVVELLLKALLRSSRIDPPRIHDLSGVLKQNETALPESVRKHVPQLAEISRHLRRDRELAFYGSEDLTPGEFYQKSDAEKAQQQAQTVFDIVKDVV